MFGYTIKKVMSASKTYVKGIHAMVQGGFIVRPAF